MSGPMHEPGGDVADVASTIAALNHTGTVRNKERADALLRILNSHLHAQHAIDTLRAQLEAAEARAEAAEAECAAMRERMHFLATDGCVEGFVNVKLDIYDYAFDSAEESGREEPNGDDLINGLCRLIDAARTKEDAA